MTTIELEGSAIEVVAGGMVRGEVAGAHLDWVRIYHGEAAAAQVIGEAPVDAREPWVPFATLIELDRAIERRCSRGGPRFFRELGRYHADLILARVGRLRRGEAIHDFLHRAAALRARLQNVGTAVYEELDLTSGRMTHADANCFSPVWCASTARWYEQMLVARHAVPLRVSEVTCRANGAAHCTFALQWA